MKIKIDPGDAVELKLLLQFSYSLEFDEDDLRDFIKLKLNEEYFMKDIDYKVAVIERPDGTTYEQIYSGSFEDLQVLKRSLGDDYWIVDIY